MKTKEVKLPNKPSELIRLALKDLKAVEKSKKYTISMNRAYHEPRDDAPCIICFAGAIIAKSLKQPVDLQLDPADFDADTSCKLRALDSFRLGEINEGLDEMGLKLDFIHYDERRIIPYENSPKYFKRDMEELAQDLEDTGN